MEAQTNEIVAMASLVYLTTLSPSQLGAQIEQAGHRVWEALSVSEVLYLLEHENIDVVVIARPPRSFACVSRSGAVVDVISLYSQFWPDGCGAGPGVGPGPGLGLNAIERTG